MQNKNIKLLYDKKIIELVLPSTYDEFMKLLEDKLYLTQKLVRNAKIIYCDQDNDEICLDEENYEYSITENNGNWKMYIYSNLDDPTPDKGDNKPGKQIILFFIFNL